MPKYFVYSRYPASKGKEHPTSFCISDSVSERNDDERPDAAIFPVNACYDAVTQRKRAFKFCNYLNTLAEVMADLENDQKIWCGAFTMRRRCTYTVQHSLNLQLKNCKRLGGSGRTDPCQSTTNIVRKTSDSLNRINLMLGASLKWQNETVRTL